MSPLHSQLQLPPTHPCALFAPAKVLEPRRPVGLGVPGGRLGTGSPSQVLVPGVLAPDSDSDAFKPAVPTDPVLVSAHLYDQAGQGRPDPQCPPLSRGEINVPISQGGSANSSVLPGTVNV